MYPYFRDTHPQPSESVLGALSEVFSVPVQTLRRLASLADGEDIPYEPPPEAARLSAKERSIVDDVIRAIVRAQPVRIRSGMTRAEVDAELARAVELGLLQIGEEVKSPERYARRLRKDISTINEAERRQAAGEGLAGTDEPVKPEELNSADQGSQADHELAARKGETEDEVRERLGIPYE